MPSSIHCFFFQTVSRTYLKVKRMLGETRRQKDCWKRMNRSDKRNRETFFFSWDLIFKTFEFKTTFRIFLMPIHAKTLVKTRKLILSVLLTNPHSVKISRMKKKTWIISINSKIKESQGKGEISDQGKKWKKICFVYKNQSSKQDFAISLLSSRIFLKEKSTETLFPPERETLVTGSLFLEKTRI